jgi:hypothetical protein
MTLAQKVPSAAGRLGDREAVFRTISPLATVSTIAKSVVTILAVRLTLEASEPMITARSSGRFSSPADAAQKLPREMKRIGLTHGRFFSNCAVRRQGSSPLPFSTLNEKTGTRKQGQVTLYPYQLVAVMLRCATQTEQIFAIASTHRVQDGNRGLTY